jgi:lipopolysaccharide/colanic/teichoic acid biosynthesis glycosyltransferase
MYLPVRMFSGSSWDTSMSSINGLDSYYARNGRIGSARQQQLPGAVARSGEADVLDQSGLPLLLAGGQPVAPVDSKERRRQLWLKRWMLDLPLATAAIFALLPLLVIIALLVKVTSPGPVLFKQVRLGLGSKPFRLLKFRTMHHVASRPTSHDHHDGQVTPLGRLLRATSLDELPQLWNVIVGEMSIVGPRPMVPGQRAAGQDYREMVPYYAFRLQMRPGLSGWAQANGLRGPTTERAASIRRIDHDCAYIQNFSVILDLKIIGRTLQREFLTGNGA